jgi:hypothetical protein
MSNPPKPSIATTSEDQSVSLHTIPEAIRDLIAVSLAYSEVAVCQDCGSKSTLLRATLSLWGTDQDWEITLPICERCASQVDAISASDGDKEAALQ